MWFLIALSCAFFASFADVAGKVASKRIDPILVSLYSFAISGLMFSLATFVIGTPPPKSLEFYIILLIDAPFVALLIYFYTKSLKIGELSLVLPIQKISPAIILATTPLFSSDTPTLIGALGVLIIVSGTYTLNISDIKNGLSMPIKSLIASPGVKEMLLVVFIGSFTSHIEKIVLEKYPIEWFLTVFFLSVSACYIPYVIKAKSIKFFRIKPKNIKYVSVYSIFVSLTIATQMLGFSLAPAAYVFSIKRISVLLGSIWGYLFFKEERMKERLTGSFISLVGVVIVVIFG